MEISQWPIPGHARYSVPESIEGRDRFVLPAPAGEDTLLHGEWLAADRLRESGLRADRPADTRTWMAWPTGYTGASLQAAAASYQDTARLAQRRVVRGASVDTFA